MLPVFGQLAGRRCLNLQPVRLVRQSLDAESVFDVIAIVPKSERRVSNSGTPSAYTITPEYGHFHGIEELTTVVTSVALRMRSL